MNILIQKQFFKRKVDIMEKDMNQLAFNLINSKTGGKLSAKNSELEKLANSEDGQKVKANLEKQGVDIAAAIENGDVATLQNALSQLLSTKEGTKLANQISKIMKEK